MKVLAVSNYYPEHVGGIEIAAGNMVRRLRQRGHEVRWIAGDVRDHPHQGHLHDVPIPVFNFAEERLGFPYPIPHPASIRTLVAEVKRCDVIHLHDCLYIANLVAFVLSRILDKPVLVTQYAGHVPYSQLYKRLLQAVAQKTIGKWLLSRAQQVVFVGVNVATFFSRFVHFRVPPRIVMNGVDTEVFKPATPEELCLLRTELDLPPGTPILLFVGRFVERKGVDLLREAIAANPSWFWILIGRPGDQDPASWSCRNVRVLTYIPVPTLRGYYASADVLVLPSVGEGFPLVVQEAMACGTPVVIGEETAKSSSASSAPFLVTPLQAQAVASRIQSLLLDRDRHALLRAEVCAFARLTWSWEAALEQYEALLSNML